MVFEAAVYGVVWPAAIAAGLLFLIRRLLPRSGPVGVLSGVLAFLLGVLGGLHLLGLLPLSEKATWARLAFLAMGACGLEFVISLLRPPVLVLSLARAVASFGFSYLIVPEWVSGSEKWFWITGLGAFISITWILLVEGYSRNTTSSPDLSTSAGSPEPTMRRGPWILLLRLVLVASLTVIVLVLSSNARFGQMTSVVATLLGGALLASIPRGPLLESRGLLPGVVVFLCGIIILGALHCPDHFPRSSFLFLGFALVLTAAGAYLQGGTPRPRLAEVFWTLAAAILGTIGLLIAILAASTEEW